MDSGMEACAKMAYAMVKCVILAILRTTYLIISN